MAFVKAKREKIWIKALIGGPSGGGKTYSSLRLAKGIANKMNTKIAAIDTENGRIRYYANEFEFDDMRLDSPYSPDKYCQAIDEAVNSGYGVLIIDSMSHEWDYCLDVHSKMPGNSYTNWSKITPMHDKFWEKILQSQIHIIATVRGKDEYVMEERNGKSVPKKVGLGYKQRDGVEYNYTVSFNVDQQSHVAESTKDNTHLFEGRFEILTEKDGEKLFDWANSGEVAEPRNTIQTPQETRLNSIIIGTATYQKYFKELQNLVRDKLISTNDITVNIKKINTSYEKLHELSDGDILKVYNECLELSKNINKE